MPFKKLKNGKYQSPSGRVMTKEQVQAYYASQGNKKKSGKKKK